MSALLPERDPTILQLAKRHAALDQLLDTFRAVTENLPNCILVTKPVSSL